MVKIKLSGKGATCRTRKRLDPSFLKEVIAKKAQDIYESNGRQPGRDLDNWLEAERFVKSQICR